ncbi:MAG: fluoride efflux transporter CrcB [Candidatus Dormibacteria bacterium]
MNGWSQSALIGAGAVAGANLRYWVGIWFARFAAPAFPWSTLTINVSGSLILGTFLGYASLRLSAAPGWRLLVAVGFCGAYTTFSTFSYELFSFVRQRALLIALLYMTASVLAGVAGVALGDLLGRGGEQ